MTHIDVFADGISEDAGVPGPIALDGDASQLHLDALIDSAQERSVNIDAEIETNAYLWERQLMWDAEEVNHRKSLFYDEIDDPLYEQKSEEWYGFDW